MATGDYTDLATLKQRLGIGALYAAKTISFTAATKTIADSALGLAQFKVGRLLTISGSAHNNLTVTIATASASAITVSQSLTDEAAGALVTLADVTDPTDDVRLSNIITAVSPMIEKPNYCGRRFYTTQNDEIRYYTPDTLYAVYIDDLLSITTLATDPAGDRTYSTVWASTDFELWPWNASVNGRPYLEIRRTPTGANYFPTQWPAGERSVQVTGKFGYSATVPPTVAEAVILQCERIYKRGDAPFGMLGATGSVFATIKEIPLDPDVANMLVPFARMVFPR